MKRNPKKYNNVLLVDDNFIDNFVHNKLLSSLDLSHQFHEHTKPQEAIEFLKLFNCFDDRNNKNFVDLIFLDLNMPKMNGWEFIEEVKKICKNIKPPTTIIVLTSSVTKSDKEKAKKEPFVSGYIQKPLTYENLVECLDAIPDSKK